MTDRTIRVVRGEFPGEVGDLSICLNFPAFGLCIVQASGSLIVSLQCGCSFLGSRIVEAIGYSSLEEMCLRLWVFGGFDFSWIGFDHFLLKEGDRSWDFR